MENELHMQLDLSNCLPMVNDGISPQSLSDQSFLRSNLCPLNTHNESIIGLPIYSSLQGEPLKDYNLNFHELCLGGTSLAPDNDVNNPSESQRDMFLSGYPYASSSSVPTSINFGYDGLGGGANSKWGQNGFPYGLEPLQLSENQVANHWVLPNSANVCSNHTYGTDNELSLSLATCRPSLPCSASVQDYCSNMSSGIINSQSQSSPLRNKELSLSFASNSRTDQFSQIISGSRYLQVLEQILSEIASYSLTSIDQTSYSTGLVSSSSNHAFSSKHTNGFTDDNGSFDPAESAYQRHEVELKKSQLLALLQVVDDCYNQCFDEIHTVVSAFRAATEVDPQLHTCFALRTISFFYKNLRERISNAILAMGMNSGSPRDNGRSFEKSFIQKKWALQQLKRKDQLLWRPQRGLPERSVSVLRAWMFDNFLHPYPKDAEKHLLAIKSGLTRSQVSNWFINARVRLWKPLVEEMCAELNRRKGARQNDEGNNYSNNQQRSQLCISDYNQRFNT